MTIWEKMNLLENKIKNDCSDILWITLSNKQKNAFNIEFDKVRIKKIDSDFNKFSTESYRNAQVFHNFLTGEKLFEFLCTDGINCFKNVTIEKNDSTLTIVTNKKGEKKLLEKKHKISPVNLLTKPVHNREKNYILKEGSPIPFLVELGIMTKDGKIHASKFDKFKQINRFLEFVEDLFPSLKKETSDSLNIVDFGCGKSYLTFALYYYFIVLKGIKANIFGLDLKKDVIENCNSLAKKLNYSSLHFAFGDIEDYRKEQKDKAENLDLVITLHACDTATDYALAYAVEHKARAILSVPCCQHEINSQLKKEKMNENFLTFAKYGIIKERFSALTTDLLRTECLESCGYKTQVLEFIDVENTPKNLLIRAVLHKFSTSKEKALSEQGKTLLNNLGVCQTLVDLLGLKKESD